MIKVLIKEKLNKISYLKISGHANSASKGEDLVCAGVSAISVGILNAIDEKNKKVIIDIDEGLVEIIVEEYDDELQLILEILVIQLKTIENKYSKYIRIIKEV